MALKFIYFVINNKKHIVFNMIAGIQVDISCQPVCWPVRQTLPGLKDCLPIERFSLKWKTIPSCLDIFNFFFFFSCCTNMGVLWIKKRIFIYLIIRNLQFQCLSNMPFLVLCGAIYKWGKLVSSEVKEHRQKTFVTLNGNCPFRGWVGFIQSVNR